MRRLVNHPVKIILILIGIGMFVGDVLFTDLINPASEWLYQFNVPILNVSFGALSMFVLIVVLVVLKLLGNNPDT